jgi:hypothetical protein
VKKHRLLLFKEISKRLRGVLTLLLITMLAIGLYDQFNPILGDIWYLWWAAIAVALLLWIYYVVLLPRATIQMRPNYLRLQGPLRGLNVSYGRVHSATAGSLTQHFSWDSLSRSERNLLEPFQGRTVVFVELHSFPDAFKRRHWWFPRLLFGTSRPGLVLMVEDWMAVSRDIEAARSVWHQRRAARGRKSQSLARRVLDET